MKAQGGKSIYGASVGILMLDARFPRIPGDMGNALTWPFPVHYRIVRDASPDRVVRKGGAGTLDDFIAAARALEADGVDGITTNCGFLALFQDELAEAVNVPVVTSSLMQVEQVNRVLPKGKRAGVLTISSSSLTDEHLRKARVPEGTPIGTTEGGQEFTRAILDNELELDVELARQDNVEAALELQKNNPELGAIVLECTNMTPYAADIQVATELPVFSIVSLIAWFQAGLAPGRYL
ncbi:aspartate/glutamate racemase family protein [Alisedimentitalea sp. MJ-SS2]|uniref:aspartate/glutamate racemase family protein n=1 Tax=Aliisedimentitalea sp. MJ-SS2 TaxID=3049795 RepID=UPI0029155145|nr:aspartate/glutamate racemase family protein [Alisedimentitalea sp. MJ-SS2]MDU8925845.1 aspartate/glutamate racemase family protein [Alisedimentitalea sp. MJ-SS2]